MRVIPPELESASLMDWAVARLLYIHTELLDKWGCFAWGVCLISVQFMAILWLLTHPSQRIGPTQVRKQRVIRDAARDESQSLSSALARVDEADGSETDEYGDEDDDDYGVEEPVPNYRSYHDKHLGHVVRRVNARIIGRDGRIQNTRQ